MYPLWFANNKVNDEYTTTIRKHFELRFESTIKNRAMKKEKEALRKKIAKFLSKTQKKRKKELHNDG